ncbi:hypothetical protein MRB53_008271 [Persea americana]|uniref:Uncharacterized protein n=1 Tax=Persea americana TaxID=3435 RepID=A0ACC2MLN4_PERAE|nr:hypothetical protein MRB53_008271 [Persea americana]
MAGPFFSPRLRLQSSLPDHLGCFRRLRGCRANSIRHPNCFLSIPIFVTLLNKAEEEFGFQAPRGTRPALRGGFFQGNLEDPGGGQVKVLWLGAR